MQRKAKPTTPLPLPRSKYQIFPAQSDDRRAAMATSIDQHGVEKPTVWDNQDNLLDGWERETICAEKGITCPREVRYFDTEAEKFQFVLTVNAHRRPSLNQKQKRAVIEAYLQGDPEVADNTLGKALGVSKNTGLKVRRRLEANGQIRKVEKTRGRDGKVRPVRYAKRIITNTPKEFKTAQDIIKDLPDDCAGKTIDITTAKRRARRNRKRQEFRSRETGPLPPDSIRLYHCPFQELEATAGIVPGSVRLILTDIPYTEVFLEQLPALADFAERLLMEGGLFVTYYGQYYLDRLLAALGQKLTYRWLGASVSEGEASICHALDVIRRWKPFVVYSKGAWKGRGRWVDVLRAPKDKTWHKWGQPLEEARTLVRYFSEAGDLVADPCGGGFTNAVACLLEGRRCTSCDEDEACVQQGRARLAEAQEALQRPA